MESHLAGQELAARLEHRNNAGVVDGEQPSADMKRGGAENLSVFSHGQLGGAAADIDVENATLLLGRQGDRTGTVGRKQSLKIVARAGADEVAALRCEAVGDGPGVVPANGFAGEN